MSDWQPLADRDPVPGDPEAVTALSQRLSATAATIREQTQRVSGVRSEEIWQGEAATEFRAHQEELPKLLGQLATRYEKVAKALGGYAPGLGQAQRMARTALQRAREAQGDIQKAKAGIEEAHQHSETAQRAADDWNKAHPDTPPKQPDPYWGPNWSGRLADAEAERAAARRLLEDAREVRDKAAGDCATAIDDAVHDDLKNETGLWHAIKKGAEWVVEHVPGYEKICQIVGVIAGVLALASLVFPVLAPLAIAVGVAALVLDTINALGTGKGWGVVALDAFALATFGIGRAFGAVARGAKEVGAMEHAAEGLRATKGVPGALKGLKVVTADGKTLTGAAARSSRLKELGTAVERYQAAGWRNSLPTRWADWRSALSPKNYWSDLKTGTAQLFSRGGAVRSMKEMAAEGGLTRSARDVTGIDRQALRLQQADLAIEGSGGVAATGAGTIAGIELVHGHAGGHGPEPGGHQPGGHEPSHEPSGPQPSHPSGEYHGG